jgi:phage terminase Nu1 subunit (DNA packaging protein)
MRMTVTEIAAHVGVHKSTVSRQARSHSLVGADGKIDLAQYQALRASGLDPVMQTSGPAAMPAGDAESGLAAERLRKMAADAQLAELELGRQQKKLLEAARVEAEHEDLTRKLRDRLLQIPQEVAADCARLGDEIAIQATITQALRRALDGLANELSAADVPSAA